MPTRRSDVVRKGKSTVYHCYSRCVRRAFLMGDDPQTGKCFNHRREWFTRRLALLADVFAIDINFFSVLSNHFHLVIRSVPRRAKKMSRDEVARRWLKAFPGKRILSDEVLEPSDEQVKQLAGDKKRIAKLRKRLSNISWLLGALKEHIARRANREDKCKGAFWEKRFGCRAVYGEHGMLAIGIYTDLNLVRAGEASLPMQSTFCSSGLRFENAQTGTSESWLSELTLAEGQGRSAPATGGKRATDRGVLEMTREEYERILTLLSVQESGRARKEIPPDVQAQLESRQIDSAQLIERMADIHRTFPKVLGAHAAIRKHARRIGKRWLHGLTHAARLFGA